MAVSVSRESFNNHKTETATPTATKANAISLTASPARRWEQAGSLLCARILIVAIFLAMIYQLTRYLEPHLR